MDDNETQVTLQFTFTGIEPINVEYIVNNIHNYTAAMVERHNGQVFIGQIENPEDDNGQTQ